MKQLCIVALFFMTLPAHGMVPKEQDANPQPQPKTTTTRNITWGELPLNPDPVKRSSKNIKREQPPLKSSKSLDQGLLELLQMDNDIFGK